MKQLNVYYHRSAQEILSLGTLVEDKATVYFQYDHDFPYQNLRLSPFHLRAESGLQKPSNTALDRLHGVFYDSLPDGWGLLLMSRYFARQGLSFSEISPLDKLSYIGERTLGALTYHPCYDTDEAPTEIDLLSEERKVEQILVGEGAEFVDTLFRMGGSVQGARPKILVGRSDNQVVSGDYAHVDQYKEYGHWIVKFRANKDPIYAAEQEYLYSLAARECGIKMTRTELLESQHNKYFATERFDRKKEKRFHIHTLAGLLQTDFRVPSLDYLAFLKTTLALTRSQQDLEQAFLLMCFNIAFTNKDDHAKNFSFLMNDQGEWRLAPAYDLCESDGIKGEHTMTVMGRGKEITRQHIAAIAKKIGFPISEAQKIIETVNDTLSKFQKNTPHLFCKGRCIT